MLNNNINMLNKYWHYVEFEKSNFSYVPKSSGIYFIGNLERRLIQIPIGLEIAYVGKSKNLRQRVKKHSDYRNGHNNILNKFLKTKKNLEFWYLETEPNEIDLYESLLIKEISKFNQNLTNKLKMKTHKGELYV